MIILYRGRRYADSSRSEIVEGIEAVDSENIIGLYPEVSDEDGTPQTTILLRTGRWRRACTSVELIARALGKEMKYVLEIQKISERGK